MPNWKCNEYMTLAWMENDLVQRTETNEKLILNDFRTFIGDPIPYDATLTPEELSEKVLLYIW